MVRIVLILILLMQALPAIASINQNPKEIVLELYKPYLKDSHAELPSDTGALGLILSQASISLQKAIDIRSTPMAKWLHLCAMTSYLLSPPNAARHTSAHRLKHQRIKEQSPLLS